MVLKWGGGGGGSERICVINLPLVIYIVKNYNQYKMENPGKKVEQIQAKALELFKRNKQQYGNAFAKYGTVGVMIRMGEKINRFSLVNRLNIELKDEEMLRDT